MKNHQKIEGSRFIRASRSRLVNVKLSEFLSFSSFFGNKKSLAICAKTINLRGVQIVLQYITTFQTTEINYQFRSRPTLKCKWKFWMMNMRRFSHGPESRKLILKMQANFRLFI